MIARSTRSLNKLVFALGALVVLVAMGVAPMPLDTTFSNPSRTVIIYPNMLFAIPLLLLGVLLLLYGATAEKMVT